MMNRDYEKISELVNQIKEGDLQAFDELYLLTYNKVYLLVLSILKDTFMAEDTVQDIFFNTLKSINKLKNSKAFIAWINKIAYCQCIKKISEIKRIKKNNYKDNFIRNYESYKYTDPLELYLLKEGQEEIIFLLSKLTEKQSTIIFLKYFEGLKISEIAYVLDIPEGTAKSRLSKANKKFRELYIDSIQKRKNTKDFNMDYL